MPLLRLLLAHRMQGAFEDVALATRHWAIVGLPPLRAVPRIRASTLNECHASSSVSPMLNWLQSKVDQTESSACFGR